MTPGALATVIRGDVVELADRTRRVVARDGVLGEGAGMRQCVALVDGVATEWVPIEQVRRRIERGPDFGPYSSGPFTAEVIS